MVQVATPHRDDFADFRIRGIVSKDDILIPNKMALLCFDLLWGREDMGVLREGEYAEKAKDNNKEFGFHTSTTILSEIYCKF